MMTGSSLVIAVPETDHKRTPADHKLSAPTEGERPACDRCDRCDRLDLVDRVAMIEFVQAHLLADAAWRARPKPLPPLSEPELDTVREIAGLVEPGARFQTGELTNDKDRSGQWGRVLGKAAQRGTVGHYRVEKLPKHGGSGVWVISVIE